MRALPVIVIGAGQAGLAASHHLRRHGIEHLVLEQGRVGETWRSQRWDTFVLNTPRWMSRLSGTPEEPDDPDAFLSAAAWIAELDAAVRRDQVPMLERTRVTSVRPLTGGGFEVRAEEPLGTTERHASAVIVASGTMNVPRIPELAGMLPSEIRQLNAGTYRGPGDAATGAVLVVGSGQSGVQIAEDLVRAGRTVHLATSRVGRVRRRYRGRDMFAWLKVAGWFDLTAGGLPDPAMRTWPNPQTSGVGEVGHTVSLQSLEGMGVRLLGRPRSVRGAVIELDDTLGESIAFGDRISRDLLRLADQAIDAAGLAAPPGEPEPADEPHPDPAAVRAPRSLDLERAGIATIVWTTGFRGDFTYLPADQLDTGDLPRQVGGRGTPPGLFFLGLPWLTRRRSAIIDGLQDDGAMVVDHVAAVLARGSAVA